MISLVESILSNKPATNVEFDSDAIYKAIWGNLERRTYAEDYIFRLEDNTLICDTEERYSNLIITEDVLKNLKKLNIYDIELISEKHRRGYGKIPLHIHCTDLKGVTIRSKTARIILYCDAGALKNATFSANEVHFPSWHDPYYDRSVRFFCDEIVFPDEYDDETIEGFEFTAGVNKITGVEFIDYSGEQTACGFDKEGHILDSKLGEKLNISLINRLGLDKIKFINHSTDIIFSVKGIKYILNKKSTGALLSYLDRWYLHRY